MLNTLEYFSLLDDKQSKTQDYDLFYNYIYLDPRKPGRYCYEGLNFSLLYEPFYVGKGKITKYYYRKFLHLKPHNLKDRSHKSNKINKIIQLNYNIKEYVYQINKNMSNNEAILIEIDLIKAIGRYDLNNGTLTNKTNGGDGVSNTISHKKGKTYEELYGIDKANEIKSKITLVPHTKESYIQGCNTRITNGTINHSEETKLKISKSNSGKKRLTMSKLKNVKRSKETCQAISNGRKGIQFSEEHINNLSESHKGIRLSQEAKQKVSMASKGRVGYNDGLKNFKLFPNDPLILSLNLKKGYIFKKNPQE